MGQDQRDHAGGEEPTTDFASSRRSLLKATGSTMLGGVVVGLEPAVAGVAGQATGTSETTVDISYDIDTLPETDDLVEMAISLEVPSTLVGSNESLSVICSGSVSSVLESTGLRAEESPARLWWDGETASATGTFRIQLPGIGGNKARNGWAILTLNPVIPDDDALQESFAQEVARGRYHVFVGPHQVHELSGYGQHHRLVLPDAASLRSTLQEQIDILDFTMQLLRTDYRHTDEWTFFVPSTAFAGYGEDIIIGDRSTTLTGALEHEYAHSRQNHSHKERGFWLFEAEATYYQMLSSYRQGKIPWDGDTRSFRELLDVPRDREADVRLTDPDTWTSISEYDLGSLVLGALDQRIRQLTDGKRSYHDVGRKLNRRGSDDNEVSLDYQDFLDILETVAGEPLDDFADRYIDGTDIPPVPDDQSLFPQGQKDFDISFETGREVTGERPTEAGDTVTATWWVENTGTDASVVPEVVCGGVYPNMELDDVTVEGHLPETEPDYAVPSPWTREPSDNENEITVTTQEFAPGDRLEVTGTLVATAAAPLDATSVVGVNVVDDADGNFTNHNVIALGDQFPVAALSGHFTTVPSAISGYDASASEPPTDGAIAEYQWAVDGTDVTDQADGATLTYEFQETGTYELSVTVVAENGTTATATETVQVEECFITTATADEPATLDSLRRFRDESMAATPVGRGLVGLYERISPPIAATLAHNPDSRTATVTRRLVQRCASLSDEQAQSGSRARSILFGVQLTLLYVVGVALAAVGHGAIRASELAED